MARNINFNPLGQYIGKKSLCLFFSCNCYVRNNNTGRWTAAVTATLLNFIRLFKKAHEENIKQAELEKKKAAKEAEMEKAKGVSLTKKAVDDS